MKCPNCGHENRRDAKFCDECGTALAQAAPDEERLARLREAVPQTLAAKALKAGSKEGERRPVTVLFADVVGSTSLAEKRDPEEAKIILEEALSLVMTQVSRYEGLVADLLGDGLLAFFGAPIAHEDDPERALRAALDIQEALSGYGEEIQQAYDVGLQVRVGLNTGPVVVGEMGSDLKMEYTAMGDAVNLASRMESQAPPGGILITEATHRLTERLFTFEPQGEIEIKGREEPVEAYLVTGLIREPASTRGIEGLRSPMVGRDQEQAQLMEAVENLVSGKGQIVTVMGEAGIGKTRLIEETREASSDKDILWLEGRALSYGQSLSLFLFQDLVRNYLGASEGESPSLIRVKLKSRTRALFGDREPEIYPYLASLLSIKLEGEMQERIADLHPEALKRRIFVVVGELLERVSQDQPVALILEDLHWADPTSIELLKGLLPSTDRAPIMILCLFRPERDRPSWQVRHVGSDEYPHRYTEITVQPLPNKQSSLLVENLLAIAELPRGVKSSILDKTQGNPFFLEEVLRALIDEGVLVRQDDRWRATSKVLSVDIPDTVQGVIRARIDGLDDEPKRIVHIASVIGKSFLYDVLQHVAQMDGRLDEHLASLQRLELIEERARIPELQYQFKHVLTQEVAYAVLLKDRRMEFHRRVAESIESLFPERLEEFYGMLGHHWSEAGEADKAVEYLLQAGDRARLAYEAPEAEIHYTRALEHLRERGDDEGVAKTFMKLGLTYHISGDYEQVAHCYEEAFATWQPAASARVADEDLGTLRLPLREEVVNRLDPGLEHIIGGAAQYLFEPLVRHDPEGNVVPAAAMSWAISEGGRRYTFRLRPNLRWSNGRSLTAHDFEFAWKRNLDPATDAALARLLYPVEGARAFHEGESSDPDQVGVRALDDHTLKVRLEAPTAYFLHLVAHGMTAPLPRWMVDRHGRKWASPDRIVTNGPFLVAGYEPGVKLVLARNPHYPGRFSGNVGRLELVFVEHLREGVPLFEEGLVDLASIWGIDIATAAAAHPAETQFFATLSTHYLAFVVNSSPFDDARVRKAFARATDREALAALTLDTGASGGFVPPGLAGHSAGIGLPHDLGEASRLLSEAGYPEGRGFPPVRFGTPEGILDAARNLADQWSQTLNVEVSIEESPVEELGEALRTDPPHLYLWGWVADYPDPDNFLRITWHSASPSNHTGWGSEEFDQLVEAAGRLTDQAERMSLYQRVDDLLISQEAVIVPLAYARHAFLIKPWVRGYRVSPLWEMDLREVFIERH